MSKKSAGKPSRISGRAVVIVAGVAAIFFVGTMVGGGWTRDRGLTEQRQQIEQCLPLADAAQVDACLAGTLR
ncbi:hypothetical protein [Gordonia sihwensis]|uniref:hypothetical protein n=1 Tax=Gordonia sihwensis TaxID=173559 RepID=UPI0012E06C6C|nr:hypothetical protein [Gordonia sihwensis]